MEQWIRGAARSRERENSRAAINSANLINSSGKDEEAKAGADLAAQGGSSSKLKVPMKLWQARLDQIIPST